MLLPRHPRVLVAVCIGYFMAVLDSTVVNVALPDMARSLGTGIWRIKQTDQYLRNQVTTDPHAPALWRVMGPLSNLKEFAEAFGCKAGDPMIRADSLKATIW